MQVRVAQQGLAVRPAAAPAPPIQRVLAGCGAGELRQQQAQQRVRRGRPVAVPVDQPVPRRQVEQVQHSLGRHHLGGGDEHLVVQGMQGMQGMQGGGGHGAPPGAEGPGTWHVQHAPNLPQRDVRWATEPLGPVLRTAIGCSARMPQVRVRGRHVHRRRADLVRLHRVHADVIPYRVRRRLLAAAALVGAVLLALSPPADAAPGAQPSAEIAPR